MKRLTILMYVTLLVISNVSAVSDSLTCITDTGYCIEIIDTNLILEEQPITIVSKENKIEKKDITIKSNNLNKLTKPANWFGDVWDAFTDLFKPVWGYYEEEGQHQEGPYFLFDRNLDGPTYTQIQMQRINKI